MRTALTLILLGACGGAPKTLDQTGLYDGDGLLAAGVVPFTPRFELWSDGAEKQRWILLPEGETIDASDPDAWIFPDGAQLWKEFAVDGEPVETRMLHKQGNNWTFAVYEWQGSKAVRVKNGVPDAAGSHDIPSEEDCGSCHDHASDGPLGLSAVQVHGDDGLAGLVEPAPAELQLPGDDLDADVLGWAHVNCGSCHDPAVGLDWTSIDLKLRSTDLASVADTAMYRTAVGVEVDVDKAPGIQADLRIAPGDPEGSALFHRALRRGQEGAMPPLATERVDPADEQRLADWITRL